MTITKKALLLTTAAFTAGFATTAAMAQDGVELDTIRIESDAAQDVLGNTEITTEDIEDRNPQTMRDVFAGETEITASGGAPMAQKVFVHGIEESLLNVTIDGARQNKAVFHHAGNVLIDPTLLKSVEVTSGLAPADQGQGALAGSIAYETKDARDLLEPGRSFGGMASVGYAENGKTFNRSLTLFGAQGGFEYLLSGTRATGSNYTDGSGAVPPGSGADLSSYIAKFAYTSDTGKRLEFSADHTTDAGARSGQERLVAPGGAGTGNYYIRPDFFNLTGGPWRNVEVPTETSRRSYTVTYTDEAPDGLWAPTIQLSYNEQELDGQQVTKGINTGLSGVVKNDFMLGNGVLTAGVDFFQDTAESTGAAVTGLPSKETLKNIGVFAQMRQDITSRVSLSYGFRADAQEFSTANGQVFKDSGISVNASADIMLTEQLSLNIGAASVWGGYELSEASLINTVGGGTTYNAWNYQNVVPSRANNARIGLRYDNGPLTVSGAVFYTEIQNAPYLFAATRAPQPTVTTRGFDATLRYSTATGYVQANYTYADVREDGAPAGNSGTSYYWGRPVGHLIGLSAAFDVAQGVKVGGSAEIALDDPTGTTPLPGYEVLNLFATYTPQQFKNVEVRLDVRNVFNETYVRRTGGGYGNPNIAPLNEPGRTIGLTVSTKF